ncbi:Uncharacterised protein [Bordetella pertussis]|nr:Uncharacterised protein [Bordetella pertussis]
MRQTWNPLFLPLRTQPTVERHRAIVSLICLVRSSVGLRNHFKDSRLRPSAQGTSVRSVGQ